MLEWSESVDKKYLKIGGYVAAGLLAAVLLVLLGMRLARPHSADDPTPFSPTTKGDRIVVIVDDKAPTVAEGAVLDGPQFDAIREAGLVAIRNVDSEFVEKKNYLPLVKDAGGCPIVIALTNGGDALVCKLPTDESQVQALLSKILNNCPPPLPAPTTGPAIDLGAPLDVQAGDGPFVDVGGHKRFLAAKPSGPGIRTLVPWRYADSHPVYPISQWRPINRRNIFTWQRYGLDQDGIGSCVAQSTVGALAKVRTLLGMKHVLLSPAALYAQINGGRDQGAIISEGVDAAAKTGTCPFDVLGQKPFYSWQIPASTKAMYPRFRAAAVYHVDTWEELGSALQTGRYLAVFGVQVGRNFGVFDRHGVSGHDRGPGNHALHADGMALLPDGRWVLDVPNSWGEEWGPWKNGRVYLDRNHLFANGDMPDCCVIRAATEDPKEPWDPPAWNGKRLMKFVGPDLALAP